MKKGVLAIISGISFLSLISFSGLVSAAGRWTVSDVLNSWANADIFKYVLPFLLIFALIFGLLEKSKILGDNRGVHAIIAITLGLLSLVGDYFPNFITKLAPNVAVGISVLVAAVILIGLFYKTGDKDTHWVSWVIFVIGAIAFLVIIADTFSGYSGVGYNIWQSYGPALITVAILAFSIWAIISGSKDKK